MTTSKSVLVTDINIWIDLENGDVLSQVFQLPYRFFVPDFAIIELVHPGWQTLSTLGLSAGSLPPPQVSELAALRGKYNNLSAVDLSAFLLAQTMNAALLTGDRRLVELANAHRLPVHGMLWLLDEMVHFQVLVPARAADALRQMLEQGARLPENECQKRIASWSWMTEGGKQDEQSPYT